MKVPMTNHDINSAVGFYAVESEVFQQTLDECRILQSYEMGGDIVIHHCMRGSSPAWLMDNPNGLRAIWIEDDGGDH